MLKAVQFVEYVINDAQNAMAKQIIVAHVVRGLY